jgi:hypothetical protein
MKNTGVAAAAAGVVFLGTVISADAAVTYSSDFEGFDPFGDVAPNDGWSIDDPLSEDGISFIQENFDTDGVSGPSLPSQAGAIGGFWNSPGDDVSPVAGTQVNLTHPVSIPLTSFRFDVDFTITGSSVSFPGVDNFGWSFLSDSAPLTPLLRVAFEAPGIGGDLEIAWYDNLGNRNLITPISQDIAYLTNLHLQVVFSPNGADADFTATISSMNSFTFSGSLIGEGSTTVDDFGADFDVQTLGNSAGDNVMIFDNLSAVPEPSATLLLLPGLLVLLRRRRS